MLKTQRLSQHRIPANEDFKQIIKKLPDESKT